MRIAVWIVALFSIVVGVLGLASPDSLTAVRRVYFSSSAGLHAAAALRVAIGLVVIVFAPRSRAPRTLRALGALICLQGLSAIVLGRDRADAILEWEALQNIALQRAGAAVALAGGVFLAFAATTPRPARGAR